MKIWEEEAKKEKPQAYGESAWVDGYQVYSTDGKPVDVKAVVNKQGMTVEDVVRWHQRQPEIVAENRMFRFVTVGIPLACLICLIVSCAGSY